MIYSINQCSVAEFAGDYPGKLYCGSSSYQFKEGQIIKLRKKGYADNGGLAKLGAYSTHTAVNTATLFPDLANIPKPPTSPSRGAVVRKRECSGSR